jgi:hypothetical protein
MSMSTTSGIVALGDRDRLVPRARLGDHRDPARRLQHRPEPGAHERLVVGEQDADHGP